MKVAIALLCCLVALTQYADGSAQHYLPPVLRAHTYSAPFIHTTYSLPLLRHAYDFDAIRKACTSYVRLPTWELYKGNKQSFFNDYRTKQYLQCYLGHLDAITLDGRFNPYALVSIVGEELSHPIHACAAATQLIADPFELSFNLVKCLDDYNPEILRAIGILHPTF